MWESTGYCSLHSLLVSHVSSLFACSECFLTIVVFVFPVVGISQKQWRTVENILTGSNLSKVHIHDIKVNFKTKITTKMKCVHFVLCYTVHLVPSPSANHE